MNTKGCIKKEHNILMNKIVKNLKLRKLIIYITINIPKKK